MKLDKTQPLSVLKYLALIYEVSYSQVCKEIGSTPQQFNDWVKKRRPVPKERLQVIAAYFQIEDNRLLVDENSYLRDLSEELKAELQILFLHRLLRNASKEEEVDGYLEKLARLEKEKREHALISRFSVVVQKNDERVLRLVDALLNQLENGDLEPLETILNTKEPES
ncbi:hypothetical protein PA598K_04038 [Paenibacillus sp. 598K]|uniref:XRE family transcriptional regulator n=1 Tax=Paenibacillus sp. 598K TaxID=1117987 RepID=UPI000FFA7E49|nr:XRE family transcriptional regulator [Paenibacillus sp. 598K]GBF75619.1 hypothetical protein PA598K_04038 [Paenibacillus sp. 598K]